MGLLIFIAVVTILYILGKLILPGAWGIIGVIAAFWVVAVLVGFITFVWAAIVNIL